MIYSPINREHGSFKLAHTGIVKHTNKRIKKETWAHYFPKRGDSVNFSKHLPDGIKDELMWVCYDGGRVVGVFFLAIDEADNVVNPMVIVSEDWRGQGVGTSLSKLAVASFKGTYKNKPMTIKSGKKSKVFSILNKIGFKQVGVDKIPILDMNGEPTKFKEIAILEI